MPTTSAFEPLAQSLPELGPLRQAICAAARLAEPQVVQPLLEQARVPASMGQDIQQLALRLAGALRQSQQGSGGLVQGLLQEFSLSSQEGVALMCLAEALLRIPDSATRDALIRDKISRGNWSQHLGNSPSLFVNAATWGLVVTGKLVSTHSESGLSSSLARLIGRGGEPLIRKGVDLAMRMMGEQFVTGQTIAEALHNARGREAQGFRFSYDMLGEAAVTQQDAQRYLQSYEQAIHAIGAASDGRGIYGGPGISIKLSALHPRYRRAQRARVLAELYPVLLRLSQLARQYDIGLNIDAEESDRLDLSLDLLERLCFAPQLAGWNGIGFVIQAYLKRSPQVVDFVVDLGRRSQHRLMVRLVKGAYWDSEIKHAQVDGLAQYPVYTRKQHTDLSYLACARRLLAASDAVYPQFATHNAHTLAAVYHLAGPDWQEGQYEFQCLHGMGEPLYQQVVGDAPGQLGRPCRVYAPVGTHETLLAYLVRRLLENGSNTSFVNRMADPDVALEDLVQDPVQAVDQAAAREGAAGLEHARIPLPSALFGAERANSAGVDLNDETTLQALAQALRQSASRDWDAAPLLAVEAQPLAPQAVTNPADRADVVGQVCDASAADVQAALGCAAQAAPGWAAMPPGERAAALERCADLLQAELFPLMGLLVREAGKSYANAVGEVREAIDFLRYYAAQARRDFDNASHQPLGPVVCISPWNFPLAIFLGQVSAALAAGNVVLAKPAEQTPLVAAWAVRALWQSGVPRAALQLLPGPGHTVGAQLVADARVQGVLFTGSTEVARLLQRQLAQRLSATQQPVVLVAETGGQNAMIVDSSALAEQVVADVMNSAFDSAGQRCSALRVLCLQQDGADHVVAMLQGAMAQWRLGNPALLEVDLGPVIDEQARATIARHIETMRGKGHRVFQAAGPDVPTGGSFVPPTLIEIDSLDELDREVFGPVLHVLRYRRDRLDELLAQINRTGYGLTLGVHTRIDETLSRITQQARVGNVYANRNMVGAVVGVQPFGGDGLSGTGPKAGGPLYLRRLLSSAPALRLGSAEAVATPVLSALEKWALERQNGSLVQQCLGFARQAAREPSRALPGPTGERNLYSLVPRERVLCLAEDPQDLLAQLAAVLATDGRALWTAAHRPLWQQLPGVVQGRIETVDDWTTAPFDVVLHHGSAESLLTLCAAVAQRPGAIASVLGLRAGDRQIALERLLVERSLSVNTAAAGGNASLMTMD